MEENNQLVELLALLGTSYPLWKAEFLRWYRLMLESSNVLASRPTPAADGSITFASEADLVEYVMGASSLAAMSGIFALGSARGTSPAS